MFDIRSFSSIEIQIHLRLSKYRENNIRIYQSGRVGSIYITKLQTDENKLKSDMTKLEDEEKKSEVDGNK